MNIGSINHTYQQNSMGEQAKLPTGGSGVKTVHAFEKVIVDINNSKPMDNKKAMNELNQGISSVEEALKSDAQVAKNNLKALFNKLSGAEAVKLDEDGFDINDMDEEELITVVDRIKLMLAAYNENYQAFAGGGSLPDAESVEDSDTVLSARVASKLSNASLPVTEENINEVASALEMAGDVAVNIPLSDEAKAYMIENQLEPTLENVYKADHSTIHHGYRGGITAGQWNQVKAQVTEIIKNAGLPMEEQSYENARWLIQNELPVTGENLLLKEELDALEFTSDEEEILTRAVDNMAGGEPAAGIFLNGRDNVWKTAAKAIRVVKKATEDHVDQILQSGRRLTIEELEKELKASQNASDQDVPENTRDAVKDNAIRSGENSEAYRTLYEARILMTATSTVSIVKQGIDIYSQDLTRLVDLLHEEETRFIQDELTRNNAGKISESDLATVSNVHKVLSGLAFAPAATIGALSISTVSITIRSAQAVSGNFRRQYEQAGQSYETMSTKVRSDMGDSMVKALRNSSEAILSDLSMEINEANMRAVRILAYNQLEMTNENVIQVRNLDSMLNNLMDNMKPQVVYDMIKDGINPMETDVETLNEYLTQHYEVQSETVKYSEFLYKLEQTKEITPEERKQYIGIYKMLHTLKKDGGKAAGALMHQGGEFNLKNLMTAVDSRRQYGMDVSMDENTGMNRSGGTSRYYDNLFSKLSRNITPGALKKASEEGNDLELLSPEHLGELMEQYQEEDRDVRQKYFDEMVDQAVKFQNIEDQVIRLLTDNQIPVSFYNLMAAGELMGQNSFYQNLKGVKNEKIEQSALRMMNALEDAGQMDESIRELEDCVEEVQENVLDAVESAADDGPEDQYLDINLLKNMGKTVHLLRELGSRQQYFIPFETENGMGSINLKVVKTAEQEGRMEMRFATAQLGNVYAELHVTETKAKGYIVSDDVTGVEILKDNVDNLQESIRLLGITEAEIHVGAGIDVPQMSLTDRGNGAASPLIYRTAKAMISNLTVMGTN
ncbi:MAG: DUF6240 domain-containing protein [Lachnospiraceae bacterium]